MYIKIKAKEIKIKIKEIILVINKMRNTNLTNLPFINLNKI